MEDSIIFLGTAGARFMIINQLLASGGMWMSLGGNEILVDPGPGCIVQFNKNNLNADTISAVIVTHRHLDHSGDVNIMVEAMTHGGFRHHGRLFAPADALGVEPIIFSYLRHHLEGVEVLREGMSYSIGNISFTTPVRHIHPVETYGLKFTTGKHTFSYISDSRYFDGLCRSYDSELLIMNVVMMEHNLPVDHLSVIDAEHIIKEIKPRMVILTHFSMSVWRAKPVAVAEWLSRRTGVKVIAASDGMNFCLSELESI